MSEPTEVIRCPECHSSNIDGPDFEDLYDCLTCGLFFTIDPHRRIDGR